MCVCVRACVGVYIYIYIYIHSQVRYPNLDLHGINKYI